MQGTTEFALGVVFVCLVLTAWTIIMTSVIVEIIREKNKG